MFRNKRSYIVLLLVVLFGVYVSYQFYSGYGYLLLHSSVGGNGFIRNIEDELDPLTFKVLDKEYTANFDFRVSRDKDTLWITNGGDSDIVQIKDVDWKSFKFLGEQYCVECYAIDNNHIYYILTYINDKWLDKHEGIVFPGRFEIGENNAIIVGGADKETFKVLEDKYAQDANFSYYRGVKVNK